MADEAEVGEVFVLGEVGSNLLVELLQYQSARYQMNEIVAQPSLPRWGGAGGLWGLNWKA